MFVWYILLAILIFGFLIFIHELGHFIVARLCGVKVLEFAIGMGPKLLSHKSKKSGIVYALRLFPIGGFVNMLGENGMEAVQGDNGAEALRASEPAVDDPESHLAKEPEDIPPEIARQAYCNQSVWKRILISLAGPAMNLVLGVVLMAVLVVSQDAAYKLQNDGQTALLSNRIGGFFIVYEREEEIDGLQKGDYLYAIAGERVLSEGELAKSVERNLGKSVQVLVLRPTEDGMDSETVALQITLNEAFAEHFTHSQSNASGLMRGDIVLWVNSTPVHTYNELSYEIMNQGHKPMKLTVLRDGEKVVLENVIVPTQSESGAVFGAVDFIPYTEQMDGFFDTVGTYAKHIAWRSISTVKMVYDSIFGLFSGRYGVETVSGPVGITKVVGEAAQYGADVVLNIVIVISINLGVMNLLPLPALDGGHILIYLIELVRRKPMKPEVEGMINFIGLILMLGLAVIIAFKDIFTLF